MEKIVGQQRSESSRSRAAGSWKANSALPIMPPVVAIEADNEYRKRSFLRRDAMPNIYTVKHPLSDEALSEVVESTR